MSTDETDRAVIETAQTMKALPVASLLAGRVNLGGNAYAVSEQLSKITALVDANARAVEADACRVRAEGEASAARRAAATEHLRAETVHLQLSLQRDLARIEAGDTEVARLAEIHRHEVALRVATLRGIAYAILAGGASLAVGVGMVLLMLALQC